METFLYDYVLQEAETSFTFIQFLVIVVGVLIYALGNTNFVEFLKSKGVINEGKAGVWQTVFGALGTAVLSLAVYFDVEAPIVEYSANLIELFGIGTMFLTIAAQSGFAKLFHTLAKNTGVTAKNFGVEAKKLE